MIKPENPKTIFSVFRTIRSLSTWHALRTHLLTETDWIITRKNRAATFNGDPIPWWTYSSVIFLQQMTKPDVSILEIGSGNSTLFWLDRGHPVTSLETNETWYAQINDMSRENYPLADLKFVEYVSPESLSRILGDRKFDVVINDGPGDRVSIHHMLIDYLTPNGFLVWDNSERETSAAAIDELTHQGWRCLHFDGMGPINAYSWRTSVLWKGSFPFVN